MNLDVKFMSYRRLATIGSLALLILSIGSLSFKGLNLGLDFSGGTLIEVSYDDAADLSEIRDLMFNNGFDDFQVVNFGSNSDVLIKVADKDGNSQLGDVIYKFLQFNINKGMAYDQKYFKTYYHIIMPPSTGGSHW